MAKRKHTKDIREALQALLSMEYVENGETLTGAETIAAALYKQATDPESPHYTKALELILKATDPRAQLQADDMRYKLTQATRERIRERTTSL